MNDKISRVVTKLNPGEAKELKARVFDLSELATKQALYGIIQVLSFRANVTRTMFEEIIDDASKYSLIKQGG